MSGAKAMSPASKGDPKLILSDTFKKAFSKSKKRLKDSTSYLWQPGDHSL